MTRMAREISREFGTEDSAAPHAFEVNEDYPRALAMYRLADVLVVNPVRDGMNLVAKEAPILSDSGCALVLSQEAGAAAELGADALLIRTTCPRRRAHCTRPSSLTDAERKRRTASLASRLARFRRPAGSPISLRR